MNLRLKSKLIPTGLTPIDVLEVTWFFFTEEVERSSTAIMIQLVPRVNGYAGNATVTIAENEIQQSVSQFPDRLSRPLSLKYLWERP